MRNEQAWQILTLNEETYRWEVVEEKGTLREAENWIKNNINEGILSGKTKGLRRKEKQELL